ncbi:alpha/beta hydrolase [Tropicibacter naphthalenivorans]|uniref:Putative esterase of the alpha/beta hydrolase fold protein n=1 Tax=Tropicibacter naphthalenivorans TaxID=441103 RepID=A0A0P1GWS1_9RHOB|nr:alpha/beta hydrolase [Tropicibacter naphthalenivorans]CUH79358.1 putative esterase of the alpha/beta hydrolase fold protein [Tropicibacter naphthalenivorans]SMC71583.1 Alpha/beta hydrolase family protein [Tropicibacter naphthalenivorans]
MELDDAYANAAYIPQAEEYPPRWAKQAEGYRQRMSLGGKARLGVMYGHATRETLDLFLPEGTPRGLFVFVHGGYWLKFDRSSWSHLAEGMRAAGYAVALPSYDLCPKVRISDITRQVAQAVTVIAHDIDGPIYLAGHSAGGHLVARLAMAGVLAEDVHARLAHVMPISPVADLRPMMRTSMNADLKITEEEALRESPVLADAPDVPVTVWVGGDERPAFIEQAEALGTAWGSPVVIDKGRHHFDVIDALADPNSAMVQRLLQRG